MTQREKDLFYEVLELLRKEVRTSSDFRDRKSTRLNSSH